MSLNCELDNHPFQASFPGCLSDDSDNNTHCMISVLGQYIKITPLYREGNEATETEACLLSQRDGQGMRIA